MAGNEIAKLVTKITVDTGDVDKKFALIKGALDGTDAKLNSFKIAVANSAKELNQAKIALDAHKLAMKQSDNVTQEMKDKFNQLSTTVQKNKLVFDSSKSALKDYENSLKPASSATGGLAKAMETLGVSATGIAVAGVAAIGAGLAALVGYSVKVSSEFEQLDVSFEVLTGGKEKGDALVASLTDLANVTPMTTQGLSDNARLLLSFGESVNNVIPDLKLLGDVSGGNQQKMDALALAFAQVGSAGKLQGQDLLQLVNAGFNPLQVISDKTGKSMGELRKEMEKGQISFSMVKDAMISATSEGGRFYGMMEKQSEALSGRLSTLSDKWGLVAKNIGDVFLPAAKKAVDWLVTITDKAMAATKSLKLFAMSLGAPINGTQTEQITAIQQKIDRLQQKKVSATKFFSVTPWTAKPVIGDIDKQIADLTKQQNALIAKYAKTQVVKNKTGDVGFKDSTLPTKAPKTKKGKSVDTSLNERAGLLKAQSDLDIASNDYTDAQILAKKIELQRQLIALYKSTTVKGKTEQIQSQTELLDLEKKYQDELLKEKIDSLTRQHNLDKIERETDLNDSLQDTKLTEQQKTDIKNQSLLKEQEAEVRFQQQILELKRKGVDDVSTLSQNDYIQYQEQLLKKLEAEKSYQEQRTTMIEDNAKRENSAAKVVSDAFGSSFKSLINGTQSVSEAFKSMITSMIASLAQSALQRKLDSLFSGAATGNAQGGGLFNTLFNFGSKIGLFANGGYTDANKPFIAGERGPELITSSNKQRVFTASETQGILGGEQQPNTNTQPSIFINNQPQVTTGAKKEDVLSALQQSNRELAAQITGLINSNTANIRSTIKNV